MKHPLLSSLLTLCCWFSPLLASAKPPSPMVIGHRGASGYLPEHTLAGYTLAVIQGADYVEPDLVSSKDGVLVARHDDELSLSTDVANHPEFAARKTKKTIDGQSLEGWFTEDFTWDELKTLRARGRNRETRLYDGLFPLCCLQDIIERVRWLEKRTGRIIGIYPETKHPSYFRHLGLALEPALLEILRRNGYSSERDAVIIQSAELGNLRELHGKTSINLLFLIDEEGAPQDLVASGDRRKYADFLTPDGLREVAAVANGVGVARNLILPVDVRGNLLHATYLVRDAHAAGLFVHAYTFRAENSYLPPAQRSSDDPDAVGDLSAVVEQFFQVGVDGVFANHPDQADMGRARWRLKNQPGR